MTDRAHRETQLARLTPFLAVSPTAERGLAMLAKAIELAEAPQHLQSTTGDIEGSLLSYCVREAIDSIFPKLSDPKIRDTSGRVLEVWRRLSAQPNTDTLAELELVMEELGVALDSATAGFVPRVSRLLSILNPGIAADLSVPAMRKLQKLNSASNASLHGSNTQQRAAGLLDGVLSNLVELVAPLALTSEPYRVLVEAGDFVGIAQGLAASSDPRIRVYLFEEVHDPRLAEAIDVDELLPGGSFWLAYTYVRRLAEEQPEHFRRLISRIIDSGKMTSELASQLLTCACLAGPSTQFDVERLLGIAGPSAPFDLIARWLKIHAAELSEQSWWAVVSRLMNELNGGPGTFRAPYGLAGVLSSALENLAEISVRTRTRFLKASIGALTRLDRDSSYAVQMYFDHPRRQISTSDLIIDTAVRAIAFSEARGEESDLTGLSEESRTAIRQGAVMPSIALASDEIRLLIASKAFAAVLDRIAGIGWPVFDEYDTLAAVTPLLQADPSADVDSALGEPPSLEQVRLDLENASAFRATWFRLATWVAHFPDDVRPGRWARVLVASSEHGTNFGPGPCAGYSVEPRDEALFDGDATTLNVSDFVERLDTIDVTGGELSSRKAAALRDTIDGHVAFHRAAWAGDHVAIGRIRNLWLRRAVLSQMKGGASDLPRLHWDQLQDVWLGLSAEMSGLQRSGNDEVKAPLGEIAREVLDSLRLSAKDRPRTAADIEWWTDAVHPVAVDLALWVGEPVAGIGVSSLLTVRGASVHLLVDLSSPATEVEECELALRRALESVAELAKTNVMYASSIGFWARWLIYRFPDWWEAHSEQLVGNSSSREIRAAVLRSNFVSGEFAMDLLAVDRNILNSFGAGDSHEAAYPVLTAVLHELVPITEIREETWTAIFTDLSSTESALRYLFLHPFEDDSAGRRRLGLLRYVCGDRARAANVWRSLDVLARSSDINDADFFVFAAELASGNRGKPMSMTGLVDRFLRSLANPDAVLVLEAMLNGNLAESRAMTQYELEGLNDSFRAEESSIPAELRTRIRTALFEIGFR